VIGMTIKITMENIGGIRGRYEVTFEKGINVVEAPNSAGKTSIIKGIRTLILPDEVLMKERHFLNLATTKGSVKAETEFGTFIRDLHASGNVLYASGTSMYEDGTKADTLSVSNRDNRLLRLVSGGKSIKPILDDFSDSNYYELANDLLLSKWESTKSDLKKCEDEYKRYKRQLEKLKKLEDELENLKREKKALRGIPIAESKEMQRIQQKIDDLEDFYTMFDIKVDGARTMKAKLEEELKRLESFRKTCEKQIADFEQKHPNIEKEIEELTLEMTELKKERSRAELERTSVAEEREEARDFLLHFDTEEPKKCPKCGQVASPDYMHNRVAELDTQYFSLVNRIGELGSKISSLENKIETLREERKNIKQYWYKNLNETKSAISAHSSALKKQKDLIIEGEREMKSIRKELEELRNGFDKSILELRDEHSRLDRAIGKKEQSIEYIIALVEEGKKSEEELKYLEKKCTFLKELADYMKTRARTLIEGVVEGFNQRIKEVTEKLEFKNFEEIYIDKQTYEVVIKRHIADQKIVQSVQSLSDSERDTIGIMLMLAGKEQYNKDFPLFVLDAVTTDYDLTRLRRIIEYLEQRVPYVVVTTLTPYKKKEEIVIKHTL
jgi:DNA repair exonuclease SbcCD ATPase subunit